MNVEKNGEAKTLLKTCIEILENLKSCSMDVNFFGSSRIVLTPREKDFKNEKEKGARDQKCQLSKPNRLILHFVSLKNIAICCVSFTLQNSHFFFLGDFNREVGLFPLGELMFGDMGIHVQSTQVHDERLFSKLGRLIYQILIYEPL